GIAEAIEVYAPERCPDVQVDVVVANILANPLIELAPRLAELCKAGGIIALSGILERQAEAVCETYSQWFTLDPVKHFEGWVRISGRKNP
ncbi:MAG TPA: 50S ribosomal protein L11 methyltransferase, partial [Pseudomonadales bacterium]|nr:50S ribosomal protein L11 methyltransferase [Pseudomonadales bacterium]